jgi:hypothetical protein
MAADEPARPSLVLTKPDGSTITWSLSAHDVVEHTETRRTGRWDGTGNVDESTLMLIATPAPRSGCARSSGTESRRRHARTARDRPGPGRPDSEVDHVLRGALQRERVVAERERDRCRERREVHEAVTTRSAHHIHRWIEVQTAKNPLTGSSHEHGQTSSRSRKAPFV